MAHFFFCKNLYTKSVKSMLKNHDGILLLTLLFFFFPPPPRAFPFFLPPRRFRPRRFFLPPPPMSSPLERDFFAFRRFRRAFARLWLRDRKRLRAVAIGYFIKEKFQQAMGLILTR